MRTTPAAPMERRRTLALAAVVLALVVGLLAPSAAVAGSRPGARPHGSSSGAPAHHSGGPSSHAPVAWGLSGGTPGWGHHGGGHHGGMPGWGHHAPGHGLGTWVWLWLACLANPDAPRTDPGVSAALTSTARSSGARVFALPCRFPSLSGTVVDPEGGPVRRADLRAFSDQVYIPTWKGRTKADGSFEMLLWPPGTYNLRVTPKPSTDLVRTWAGSPNRRFVAQDFVVGPDTHLTGITIAPAYQGHISGVVTGPGGAPVAGALAGAYDVDDPFVPTRWATSQADGSYAFDRLPAGTYRVQVVPPDGSGLVVTWYVQEATRSGADPIDVSSPGARATADVALAGTP